MSHRVSSLQENCSSLEVLELNNCIVSTDFLVVNIERLQSGCPHLKILRIANTKVMARSVSQKERVRTIGLNNETKMIKCCVL